MKIYFETNIGGDAVTIAAKANDFSVSSNNLDLNIFVITKNKMTPLYEYAKNIEDIERITDACLDELQCNQYTGEFINE